jgi:hypothetical protein
VYKLIEAHFEGSVDAQGEIQEAEKNIAQFSQGDLSAQESISKYAILVRKLLRAGSQIAEQRKIQLCLQDAKAEMQDGFMESVRLAKLNGSYNGQEYKVWAAFKSVMGRVGRSLPQLVLQTGRMTHSRCHRFTQYKSIILRVLRMMLQFFKLQ